MALDLKQLTCENFCGIQGVDKITVFSLNKKFGNKTMSYDEWHELTKDEYLVGDKKEFVPKEAVSEDAQAEAEETQEEAAEQPAVTETEQPENSSEESAQPAKKAKKS